MELIKAISVVLFSAILSIFLMEPIKNWNNLKYSRREKERNHDVKLFNILSKILPEGLLRGTMYSIKVNREFSPEFIAPSDQYQLYIEFYEDGKYINQKIERAHSNFLTALKKLEQELFNDFGYHESGYYRPNLNSVGDKKNIKIEYNSLIENVNLSYSKYRILVKRIYQL